MGEVMVIVMDTVRESDYECVWFLGALRTCPFLTPTVSAVGHFWLPDLHLRVQGLLSRTSEINLPMLTTIQRFTQCLIYPCFPPFNTASPEGPTGQQEGMK